MKPMINMVLPVFLFLLVALIAPSAATATATADSTDALFPFDYLVLALTWPGSFCIIQKDLNDTPCKDISHVPRYFTIHGLWPNLLSGAVIDPKDPRCSRDKLVANDLNPNIKLQAIQGWPDIKENIKGTTKGIISGLFWQREWDKHGVCSNLNPEDYMELTLQRYQNLLPHIMNAIKDLPYPRSPVNHVDFTNKITTLARVIPKLVCKNLTQPPYSQYLVEIHFNMTNYPPYNLQDVKQKSNCVSSIPVNFPQ